MEELSALNLYEAINFDFISSFKESLLLVKMTVEALCRSDANIIQAEGALSFQLIKLQNLNSDISQKMLTSIKNRIHQRQNKNLLDLAKYILNPSIYPAKEVLNLATKLLKRLYPFDEEISNSEEDEEQDGSLQEELNSAIKKALTEAKPNGDFDMLRQEFILYKKTKNKTKNISLLHKAIKTIKPSSTECERAFSIAGKFCTKLRSRLSDSSLSALIFLKFYYLHNKS